MDPVSRIRPRKHESSGGHCLITAGEQLRRKREMKNKMESQCNAEERAYTEWYNVYLVSTQCTYVSVVHLSRSIDKLGME